MPDKEKMQKEQYSKPYHWMFNTARGWFDYHCLNKIILKLLKLNKKDVVLDAGCGDGRLTWDLTQYSGKVYGIDNSQGAIEYAKVLVPKAHFSLVDLKKTDFSDSYFDKIVLKDVIEHISPEDLMEVLVEMKRILKEKGTVLIAVPSINFPLRKKHYQHFSPDSLEKLLSKHFRVEKIIGYKNKSKFLSWLYRLFVNRHIQISFMAHLANNICRSKKALTLVAIGKKG